MTVSERPERGSPPAAITGTIEEQAAAWRDLMLDPQVPATRREAFERWREQSAAHAEAYDRIERGWQRVQEVARSPELLAMGNDILGRVAERAGRRRQRVARQRWLALAAGVVLLCTAGLAATGGSREEMQWLAERARHALAGESLYRTGVGERLTVALSDGSQMTLNTRSRAAVRYRDGIRGIALLEGQAMFDVAHDGRRPFVVSAANRRVTALGTVFDVRLSSQQLEVTLVRGRVAVEAAAMAPSAQLRTELAPGEQFVAALAMADAQRPEAFPAVRAADVERTTSWRNGQVLFEGDALRDVLRELNRYSEQQFVLADDRLADLRVSGAFNTGNAGAFIDMLAGSYLPIRIVEADRSRIVLGYRDR